ncbi:DMT family transporter [Pelagibacterium xiamenense]|uniref:DMT family transporter n=1 Tax=Pelagibacterium xiamenense TaxID=2901140 RepID=UPI001E5B338C|nr:DMT family transporter [Pelagibacterium xiamenense]MCD7059954.1 DMT family transporter [Pelagibacterium xiamenense]
MRIALLTALAMIAFAGNSILARLALGGNGIDAPQYTGIRLASGAICLALILAMRSGAKPNLFKGSWPAAAALFGYALAFSLAYLMLGAGPGALVLFASVQIGMLSWAIIKGDRPGWPEWLGFAVAVGGLVYLVSPGLAAPDPLGAALMVVSGLCWAAYSLIGRSSKAPLDDTTGNFVRCAPPALALIAVGLATQMPTAPALAYAVASGALASGAGYAIWYAALPALSRSQAAFVQLTVPAIAAAGAVVFIGEPVTLRLVIASIAILGGVALALAAARYRR